VNEVEFATRAIKDLAKLDRATKLRILDKIADLRSGLSADVKALTNFGYGYRLRVGDYRVLFDIEKRDNEADKIIIRVIVVQRVLHRREVYK
jgi:mRNA interferase RelE/StbE